MYDTLLGWMGLKNGLPAHHCSMVGHQPTTVPLLNRCLQVRSVEEAGHRMQEQQGADNPGAACIPASLGCPALLQSLDGRQLASCKGCLTLSGEAGGAAMRRAAGTSSGGRIHPPPARTWTMLAVLICPHSPSIVATRTSTGWYDAQAKLKDTLEGNK